MIDQRTMHERMYDIHAAAEKALSAATERCGGGFMTTSATSFRVDLTTPTTQYAITIRPELPGREHYRKGSAWVGRVYIDGHSPIDVRGHNVTACVKAAVKAADEALAGVLA